MDFNVTLTVNTNLTTPLKSKSIKPFRVESEKYSNLAPKKSAILIFKYFDISSVTLTVIMDEYINTRQSQL
ncbi:hypothetical protein SFRURICE_012567 [Spodoptera frugiperda]|nr:hypothetical protein SFRURICE_012567 [Spodoptera frugiperda]